MWPLIIPAVASLVGGLLANSGQRETNATNSDIANRANEMNVAEAARNREFQAQQTSAQMAFQERMSNTVHQREVEDLKKAGINPLLAKDSGAPMAQGAAAGGDSAHAVTAQMQNPNAGLSGILTTALDSMERLKGLDKADKEIGLLEAQTKATGTKTALDEKDLPAARMKAKVMKVLEDMFNTSGKQIEKVKKNKEIFKMPDMFPGPKVQNRS